MSKSKQLSFAVHRALTGVAIATAASVPALAQDAPREVEEVVTTGSRLPVDTNLITTSPVTTVSADELKYSGVTRVEDLVNDLPQIVPELTSNDSNGSTGTATLDLRGLGSDRTLVLVNGHRMGFGDPFALAPDINQIPGNLIEQVELLTGGASSTYGSDAVSGVVNFIMKDDFEGFQVDIQRSGYQHDNSAGEAQARIADRGFDQAPGDVTDGETLNVNVIMGMNSADGRGNVTGYLGYRDIKAIRHSERDYSACALRNADNPDTGATTQGAGTCGGSSTIPTGRFTDFGAGAGVDLTLDQSSGDFVDRDGLLYNYGPLNYFQRPDERFTGGLFANYDLSDKFQAYGEFMFMDDRSLAQIAPSGAFFVTNRLSCANPFLSAQQLDAIGCNDPTLVDADGFVPMYVGRRNVEGGPRFDDLQHTSNRSLVGFRGELTPNWNFDAFINFANTRLTEVYNNDLSITKVTRALDAVNDGSGNVVCRSVIDGSDPSCVPWNIFTPGGVTQAALNYIDLPLFSKADMEMNQGVAFVSGDLTDAGIKFPSADNGVQVVFGLEYRDESMVFDLDNGYNNGDGAGQGGATADVSGAVLVKEFFTEAKIPVVEGAPWAEALELDLRYRTSDYDTGVDADTWNIGGSWSPTNDYKFRASVSRAVRAPNINELFAPQTLGLWQGTDPCAGASPTLSQAECAATGVPAAFYGMVPASPADQYNAVFGGNRNLDAETSDSFTVGVVLTPESWAAGLTLSLDYWQIEVEDAISTVGQEFVINRCATAGELCNLINRNPVNGNLWIGSSSVISTNVNIGKFEVAGWDVNATYATDIGNHGLNFAMRGTLLDTWDDQPVPGGVVNDCVGFWGSDCGRPRPEWKHTFSTTWNTPREGLDVIGAWRHVGEVKEFSNDRFSVDGQNYFDVSASYYMDDLFGGETTFTAGITNILDEEPPFSGVFNTAPFSNGNTIPGTWDPLGRYWFLGLTHSR
ncbi:MAG: TonB-dependent receptor [Gammaproteobacteria bacterium]|nr:TonB-dependent receptor [Gammaproteobacteria bacterium]